MVASSRSEKQEKARERHLRWREANREKLRERSRRYYASTASDAKLEKERERARRYREDNPEYARQYRNENPNKAAKARRRWRKENADKERGYVQRRRALKANAPQGDVALATDYEQILREGICELCGARGSIHVDHIEPLSGGGEHGWENFAGLCSTCNTSKGAEPLLRHMLKAVS